MSQAPPLHAAQPRQVWAEHALDRRADLGRHRLTLLTNADIANKLFVAITTVDAHLRNINSKLGVHNRTQVVVVAQKRRLIRIG
jgi:LuxR family maltose regulon positive regulatory protein